MKIKEFLCDKLIYIITFIVWSLLLGGFLWLIEIRIEFIWLLEIMSGLIFIACIVWDFVRKWKYYQQMWGIFDGLEKKTLLAEVMEVPHFIDGKILYQVVQYTNKYMNDCLAESDRVNREYKEYIEMWVHEIKTPITSAHLIIENNKNITTLRIDSELQKIDRFVEQALFYARSTAIEKDFKIEKTTLKSLVHAAIKNYSKSIIESGGHLHFQNVDIPVLADTKWCIFIIGQIIANSIKYRNEKLELFFEGNKCENKNVLIISDNGIGIQEEDLTRVFDKGFTGYNGRRFTKSTGIGLYLCKKICLEMNMDITIESDSFSGTVVKIIFHKSDYYME